MEIKDNGTLKENFLRATTDENGNVNIHKVGVFPIEKGKEYFTIDCSDPRKPEVGSHKYDGGSYDKMVQSHGNFFPTRAMAEQIANAIRDIVYSTWCQYEDLMTIKTPQSNESES